MRTRSEYQPKQFATIPGGLKPKVLAAALLFDNLNKYMYLYTV